MICVGSLLVFFGCSSTDDESLEMCSRYIDTYLPVDVQRDVDLLFVIDTAPSMQNARDSLAWNLPRMMTALENVEGGLPNMHIGVVSADLGVGPYAIPGCTPDGDGGLLLNQPRGTCTPPDGLFISDIERADGNRERNYDGSLADALSCIVPLEADGCSFSQPLEAMYQALSNPQELDEFVRDSALLHVVFITNQDDCSVTDPSVFDPDDPVLGALSTFRCFEHGVICAPDDPQSVGTHADCVARDGSMYMRDIEFYADFLKAIKDDPSNVLVTTVSAGPEPVTVSQDADDAFSLELACDSPYAQASPSVRLHQLQSSFPQRNNTVSICNEDLSEAMLLTVEQLLGVPDLPCIDGAIDLEPDLDGLQSSCTVSEVYWPDTPMHSERVLPACSSDAPAAEELPCWRLAPDPTYCPDTETAARLEIYRGPEPVSTGTQVRALCATACMSE